MSREIIVHYFYKLLFIVTTTVDAEDSLVARVTDLLDSGVRAIGGCCRVRPDKIRQIRQKTGEWRNPVNESE